MNVYISADMEGITGIVKFGQITSGRDDYGFARRMMASDVNATISGAFDAGAVEVLVNDSHGSMDNLLVDMIDPRALLLSGTDKKLSMCAGIDRGFDAAVFIGYHSRKGAIGNLSHTYYSGMVSEVRINGRPVAEYEINALVAGHFGIPLVFLSGDNEVVANARQNIPGLRAVAVKEVLGSNNSILRHPEVTAVEIRAEVKAALLQLRESGIQPLTTALPLTLEIVFSSTGPAGLASLVPGFEEIAPNAIRLTAPDMITAYRAFLAALYIGCEFKD